MLLLLVCGGGIGPLVLCLLAALAAGGAHRGRGPGWAPGRLGRLVVPATANALVYLDLEPASGGTELTQTVVIAMPNFLTTFLIDVIILFEKENVWQDRPGRGARGACKRRSTMLAYNAVVPVHGGTRRGGD